MTFGIRLVALAGFALAAAGLVGCGGSKEPGAMTEAEGFEQFFAGLDDYKEMGPSMAKTFAAGSVPPAAELRKYRGYSYQLEGKPAVKDGTATFTVKILQKDKEVARKEWVAVTEDKSWKLKSAPLP